MLGSGHATVTTTAATAATSSNTTAQQQQQRKRVSMMEAAQGITIALGQTITVQLDAPPDAVRYTILLYTNASLRRVALCTPCTHTAAQGYCCLHTVQLKHLRLPDTLFEKLLIATHTHSCTVVNTVMTYVELFAFAVQHSAFLCASSRWHMPFATAAVGNSPASIVSITGDSQSASTDTAATTTASATSRSTTAAAYFEKSKLTGATMLHIKGLREGYVLSLLLYVPTYCACTYTHSIAHI
jgi:hypothetical protein